MIKILLVIILNGNSLTPANKITSYLIKVTPADRHGLDNVCGSHFTACSLKPNIKCIETTKYITIPHVITIANTIPVFI